MKNTLLKACFAITYLLTSTIHLIAQCPITVSSSPLTSTICSGNSVNLTSNASSGSAIYSWSPTTGLSNSAISNPIASPTTSTTYTVTAILQNGIEKVNNGSFESGNTGFSSNYTYVGTPSGTALSAEGTYTIGSNPNAYHSNFPTFSDHTTGAGINYMIVNGAGVGTKVWYQTMAVTPGQTYQFSCWVATIIANSTSELAILNLDINGTNVGAFFSPSMTQGAWTQYITSWVCPVGTTSITLCVENANLTASGNDFGIDDISFQKACIATSSLTVNVISPIASNNGGVCSGQNVNLTSNTIGGATYAWTGPSFTANTQNTSVTGITTSGNYTVNITSGGITCPASTYVTVNPLPTSSIAAISSICLGQSVNLAGTVSADINVPVSATSSAATTIPDAGITNAWTGTGSTFGTSNIAVTGLNTNWTLTSVVLNITHTWDSDVKAYLYNPCGNRIKLISGNGGSANNFTNTTFTPGAVTAISAGAAPFTGTFIPAGGAAAWAAFITASQAFGTANGTWSIHIGDYAGGDTGTLTNWTLNFNNPNSTSYVWSPTTNMTNSTTLTPTVTPTVAGTTVYTLTATNTYTCVSTATISLTAVALPVMTSTNTASVCNGNTVSIPLTSSIASTYTWIATANSNVGGESTTSQTSTTLSNTLTNTTGVNQTVVYTVTPTSVAGTCLGTPQTVTVTVTPTITPTFTAVAAICSGATAPILPTSSTNTPAITGTWGPAVSNTVTTTYTFTPTAGQCATTTTLSITVNPSVTPTFAAVEAICSGETAPVLPTSSTNSPSITGTWAPAVSNTTTTTYSFTPTAGLCATTTTLTITVNPQITPTFTAVSPICSGDVAPVLPTSSTNTPAISGTWAPAVSNTATTTYTFTPTAGQCDTTTTLTITVNPNVTPTFSAVAAICSGATAPVLPTSSTNTPAITGTWAPVVSNTATTTYTFTPTAGQCAINSTLTITVNPIITPTFVAVSDVCLNSTAPVLPTSSINTPAITGTWAPVVSTATAGTATYTFTPTLGQCAVTTTLNIVTTSLIIPTFAAIDPICSGTTAPVLPTSSTNTPAIIGTWSSVVNNTTTGTYTFTPAAGQCSGPTTLSITVNPLPTISAGIDQTICLGIAPISLTGSGALTYIWNNGITNGIAFNPAVGSITYSVTGTDFNGCVGTDQVVVIVYPNPIVNAGIDQTVCIGTTVTLNGSGTTSYSWNNGITNNASFTPALGLLTYTLTGTDTNGCVNSDQVVVTVVSLPVVNAGIDQTVCDGTSVTLIATGGLTYNWNNNVTNNSTFIPSNGTTTYTVIGTDIKGCTNTDQVEVTSNTIPSSPIVSPLVYCVNDIAPPLTALDAVQGNGIGIYSFNWYTSIAAGAIASTIAPTPSTLNPGTTNYYVSETNIATGCQGTISIIPVLINPLTTSTFNSINAVCEGSPSPILPLISTNIPSYTGSWNPSIINTTTPGTSTYTFIPTVGQCASIQTIEIIINPLPVLVITSPEDVCFPETVDLTSSTITAGSTGTDLLTYWSSLTPLTTLSTPTQITTSGTYFIQSTSLAGCSSSTSVNVLIHSLPIASFTSSPSIFPSYYTQSTMINNSINASDYIWDFGDQSANSTLFSPSHEFPYDVYGNYTIKLTAISEFGCINIAYETVTVKEELVYYVPNSFTPDENNLNDDFLPVFTSGYDPNDYSLLIFNRWGEIVFESYDTKIGWNGKIGVDGNTVQIGTYTWKIEFKSKLSPQKQIKIGHVNVIR